MADELVRLIAQYGALTVFVNVLLEQIGFPIPSLPTLLVAGAVAAVGQLDLLELFFAAMGASIVADASWYAAGWRYGSRVMRTLCRLSLTPDYCVGQAQARFERWGVNALVLAKFVPGLAMIARPLAGTIRIGWPRFLYFDSLGAALWVGAGLGVGALFSQQIDAALRRLSSLGWIALEIIAALLVVFIAFKWQQRRSFIRTLRMARISVDELYQLMRSATEPLIIDVRSATARSSEPQQIPGSLHVPLDAIDHHVVALPRDREIILYCTCPNEASAARVAKLLIDRGFAQVRPLQGGLDAWIAAGYGVEPLSEATRAGDEYPATTNQ